MKAPLLTRKNFLIGSMSVAAMGARQLFAAAPGTVTGTPRLKVGVLSDVHLDCNTQRIFQQALMWFRSRDVDAVVVAGDMCNYGVMSELKYAADAWFKVFPNNKTPEGKPVTQLFCYGNHCVHPIVDWHKRQWPNPEDLKKHVISCDPKAAWEKLFHEAYSPIFSKTVKGYQFTGVHWTGHAARDAWFAAHAKEIDPSLPFFYFQHQHPKNTCYGPWAWGHDDGTATRLLSAHPNAIALSGHSHYSLTDERTVWQGDFTSIGTGSLVTLGLGEPGLNAHGHISKPCGRQGMLFMVCEDHIRIERRSFYEEGPLGDDWILPIGKGAAKPFEFAKRTAISVAPQFEKGAVATAELEKPKPGKDGKVPPPRTVILTYPAAKAHGIYRVSEYEVQAIITVDGVEKVHKTWRARASTFPLPLSQANLESTCRIPLAALPKKTAVRFDIRPGECFGKRGNPIRTAIFTTPA